MRFQVRRGRVVALASAVAAFAATPAHAASTTADDPQDVPPPPSGFWAVDSDIRSSTVEAVGDELRVKITAVLRPDVHIDTKTYIDADLDGRADRFVALSGFVAGDLTVDTTMSRSTLHAATSTGDCHAVGDLLATGSGVSVVAGSGLVELFVTYPNAGVGDGGLRFATYGESGTPSGARAYDYAPDAAAPQPPPANPQTPAGMADWECGSSMSPKLLMRLGEGALVPAPAPAPAPPPATAPQTPAAAPPPAPPAPGPFDPTNPFNRAMLGATQGIDGAVPILVPSRAIVLDFLRYDNRTPPYPRRGPYTGPFAKEGKRPRGFFDPSEYTPREPTELTRKVLRSWSIDGVRQNLERARERYGVHVKLTARPRGRSFLKSLSETTRTQLAARLRPGMVLTQSPFNGRRVEAHLTSPTQPVELKVNYYEPALDPKPKAPKKESRPACDVLEDTLRPPGTSLPVDFDRFIDNKVRTSKCDHEIRLRKVRDETRKRIRGLELKGKRSSRKLVIEVWEPRRPDLAVQVVSAGTTTNPGLDDRGRLPATRNGDPAAIRVKTTTAFARPFDASGRPLPPLGDAEVTAYYRRRGASTYEYLASRKTATHGSDAGQTPQLPLRVPAAGTVALEVRWKPSSGPELQGWMTIPVVDVSGCHVGLDGWIWRYDSRGWRRSSDCGRTARSAQENQFLRWMCDLVCPLVPAARPILVGSSDKGQAVRRVRRPEPRAQVRPSFTCVGGTLGESQAPPTMTTGPAVAEGVPNAANGGPVGGGLGATTSTRLADLGADGCALTADIEAGAPKALDPRSATTRPISSELIGHAGGNLIGHAGGNIIAAGGGNIIAAGGGNIIATGGLNAPAGIIAAGGGNIISTGGGNIIAAGGGN